MRSYFLMASLLLASQTALAENNIQQLQGYDISRATAAFTQALRSNDSLYAALRQQPDLIKRLMLRPDIQNQLADRKITIAEATRLLAPAKTAAALAETDAGKKAAHDIAALLQGQRADVATTAATDLTRAADSITNGTTLPTDETGLTKEEAAARARAALEKPGSTPIIISPPVEDVLVDINAIPEQGVDSRGWASYLNVPESCGAPDPNRTYFHTFYASMRKGLEATRAELTQNTWVKSWFRTNGLWMYITMTDNETYAVPFITPNVDHNDVLQIINDHGRPMNTEWSISECPGQFTNLPAGCFSKMSDMFIHYDSRDSELRSKFSGAVCHLEPNKQYYMNFHTVGNSGCSGENALAATDPNWPTRRGKDGINYPVCVQTVDSGQQNYLLPPYTGVGVSQDPRPLNYFSGLGATNTPYYQHNCALGAFGGNFDKVHACADPQDKVESTTYHYQCRNQQGRWVGDVKPAYSAYACENVATRRNGEDIPVAEALVQNQNRGDSKTVCARPREGQVRETRCRSVNHAAMHPGYRQQQCQYVPESGRYMWLTVSLTNVGLAANNNLYSHAGDITCNDGVIQMPARDTCEFNGVQYAIGTKRTTTCAGKTMVSECRVAGENRHEQSTLLPAFVRVSGETMSNPDIQISSQCSYTFN